MRPGWSARQIAAELERDGVIRSRFAFLALHYVRGRQNLKAGEYRLARPASALEIFDRLVRGDIVTRSVVIPEGYNMFEIAAALGSAEIVPAAEFLKV
ncbi:MAG: endolytic transglycosylase MltG, partial [Terriglobales bacterium]